MDRRTPAGNPERVPPVLAAIDQPQEGLPRIIHPIVLAVGRHPSGVPDPAAAKTGVISMSDQYAEDVVIKRDGTYLDEQGNPFRFKAGSRISAARASAFPDLARQIRKPIRGTQDARSLPGAPQNKAEGVPENRGEALVRGNEGTATATDEDKAPAAPKAGAVSGDAAADAGDEGK